VKRRRLLWLLLPALLLLSLPMALSSSSATHAAGLTAGGTLSACPSSPNCVCSEGPDPSVQPFAFEGDPDAAFTSLLELLRDETRVELVTAQPDYAHAVFRTPVLRFRDDVELRLDRAAHRIHVRSASRLGYSDLGTNRRRIESLRTRWRPPR
jgi:uncharacterized protein (DUF1499 family)